MSAIQRSFLKHPLYDEHLVTQSINASFTPQETRTFLKAIAESTDPSLQSVYKKISAERIKQIQNVQEAGRALCEAIEDGNDYLLTHFQNRPPSARKNTIRAAATIAAKEGMTQSLNYLTQTGVLQTEDWKMLFRWAHPAATQFMLDDIPLDKNALWDRMSNDKSSVEIILNSEKAALLTTCKIGYQFTEEEFFKSLDQNIHKLSWKTTDLDSYDEANLKRLFIHACKFHCFRILEAFTAYPCLLTAPWSRGDAYYFEPELLQNCIHLCLANGREALAEQFEKIRAEKIYPTSSSI